MGRSLESQPHGGNLKRDLNSGFQTREGAQTEKVLWVEEGQ